MSSPSDHKSEKGNVFTIPLRSSANLGQQDNGMVSISHNAPTADVGGDEPRTDVAGTPLGTMTSTYEMQRESVTFDQTVADSLGDAMHATDATAPSKETKYDPATEAILDQYKTVWPSQRLPLPPPESQSSSATTAKGKKKKVDLQPLTRLYEPVQAPLMYTSFQSRSEAAPLVPKGSKFLGTEFTLEKAPTTNQSPKRGGTFTSSHDMLLRIEQSLQDAKIDRDDSKTEADDFRDDLFTEADHSLSDALQELAPDQEAG